MSRCVSLHRKRSRAPIEGGKHVDRVVEAADREALVPICSVHTNNAIVGVDAYEVACTALPPRNDLVATAFSSYVAPAAPQRSWTTEDMLQRDDI